MAERGLPSMARRLLWVTGLGSLLIAVAVSAAAVLVVDGEVDELLDDGLQASALQLAPLLLESSSLPADAPPSDDGELRFAWAWFDSAGRLVRASRGAEPAAWQPVGPGFADRPRWRLYGLPLRQAQGLLLVAQTRAERDEVRLEVSGFALLAALALALLGLPLLAWRAQQELLPLRRLGERLAGFDALQADPRALPAALGEAERGELRPMHEALAQISQRLGERLAFEREFSAQAAHLLRTPLAGMDAQLAVALKEAPWQPRLQRVREASRRLQHLVVALLRLFRSEPQLQAGELDARELLASLPLGTLQLIDGPPCRLRADAELLAAALLNLIDNAQRHGAARLWLEQRGAQALCLRDDGTGLDRAQRLALRDRLDADAEAGGLGLRLALLVAQAHGGHLELPETESGFAVLLQLSPHD